MKSIKQVVFYQPVRVDGRMNKFFTPDENISDAAQRTGLTANVDDKGVMLYSKTDAILVPWNNVCYVQFNPESEVQVKKTK